MENGLNQKDNLPKVKYNRMGGARTGCETELGKVTCGLLNLNFLSQEKQVYLVRNFV